MQWFAQAPANIALIKYMGKNDSQKNIPANPSLSYTLPNLLSSVMLEAQAGNHDYWEPLEMPGANSILNLSHNAQKRFLNHLQFIKDYFEYEGSFVVRSCNNFPLSSGLASSASSFAALTKCAVLALCELQKREEPPVEVIASLSQIGSGSSCRSFFSPWALWQDHEVGGIDISYQQLIHQVIVISHEEKAVSSSEAHKRVLSSHNFAGRPQRATENLKVLLNAFEAKDWHNAYLICWREFQDMHQLFSSCEKPFSYMTQSSRDVLQLIQDEWNKNDDGPIVTMDAGPNIHLLYRLDQQDKATQFKQRYLVGNYDVL